MGLLSLESRELPLLDLVAVLLMTILFCISFTKMEYFQSWFSGLFQRDLCLHQGTFIYKSRVCFQEFALWPLSMSLIKFHIVRGTLNSAALAHPETNVLQVPALLSPSGSSGMAPDLWKCGERTQFLQINIISWEMLSGGSREQLPFSPKKVLLSHHLLLGLTFKGKSFDAKQDCLQYPSCEAKLIAWR